MRFCSDCGSPVRFGPVDGDPLPRYVCTQCQTIHYQNPKVVCGCLATWEDRILFCKRAIEPRYGYWTLPAGFMENGETTAEGAQRETQEEANATVTIEGLYCVFNIPQISQIYMMFRGTLVDGLHSPGAESLETVLWRDTEIPWEQLAFPAVKRTLKFYLADRQQQEFPVHVQDL